MRSIVARRSLASMIAVVGITAGTLVGVNAATGYAAGTTTAMDAGSAEVGTLAVNNLGLTRALARDIQRWVCRPYGYDGDIDGYLGTKSWEALQLWLRNEDLYSGRIDGIVGEGTIKGLQRYLKEYHRYTGLIDGIAGEGTRAAFWRMAESM
jgi:lysozyme family protein